MRISDWSSDVCSSDLISPDRSNRLQQRSLFRFEKAIGKHSKKWRAIMMQLPERIEGLHHITVATGTAQGDVDLLDKTLGQRLVKKTMFYDGARPVFHLYFGNELAEPATMRSEERRGGKEWVST